MPARAEVICRNPKCFAKGTVYIENTEALEPLRFYVFRCPNCGKDVPIAGRGFEKTEAIPEGAILAKPLM